MADASRLCRIGARTHLHQGSLLESSAGCLAISRLLASPSGLDPSTSCCHACGHELAGHAGACSAPCWLGRRTARSFAFKVECPDLCWCWRWGLLTDKTPGSLPGGAKATASAWAGPKGGGQVPGVVAVLRSGLTTNGARVLSFVKPANPPGHRRLPDHAFAA